MSNGDPTYSVFALYYIQSKANKGHFVSSTRYQSSSPILQSHASFPLISFRFRCSWITVHLHCSATLILYSEFNFRNRNVKARLVCVYRRSSNRSVANELISDSEWIETKSIAAYVMWRVPNSTKSHHMLKLIFYIAKTCRHTTPQPWAAAQNRGVTVETGESMLLWFTVPSFFCYCHFRIYMQIQERAQNRIYFLNEFASGPSTQDAAS